MEASFSCSFSDMREILVASITYTTQWIFSCRDAGLDIFCSSGWNGAMGLNSIENNWNLRSILLINLHLQAQKHEPMLLLYSGLVRDLEECCWCPQYPVLHLIAPRVPWCHTTQMVTAFPHDHHSLDMCETTNKQKSLWNNCFILQTEASPEVLLNLYLYG